MNGKKFMKGATTAVLAGALAATGCANPKEVKDGEFQDRMTSDDKQIVEFYDYVQSEDIELYDAEFVNFYRDGIIIMGEKEYKVTDLYLESGLSNGEESLFLVYYRFPNNDLLSGKEKVNFKRTSIMEFRTSYVFYEMFQAYRNMVSDNKLTINEQNVKDINDIVQSSDGSMHMETPETSYGRVKPRS